MTAPPQQSIAELTGQDNWPVIPTGMMAC